MSNNYVHVTGKIEAIVKALNRLPIDPLVEALTEDVDNPGEVKKFSAPVAEYYSFPNTGLKLLFENLFGIRGSKVLSAVLIVHEDDVKFEPKCAVYPDPTGFIDGIDLRSSTRAEVRKVLGEPYDADGSESYLIQDNRVVHVRYKNQSMEEDLMDDVMGKVQIMASPISEKY